MLDRASLARVLNELKGEGKLARVDGYVYRSIGLRHFLPPSSPSPLYAASASSLGTRFVSPNRSTSSLYLALEVETAHREGNQPFYRVLESTNFDPTRLFPPEEVVLIGVHVRLARMLDVSDPEVSLRLGTTLEEMIGPWKTIPDAPTQRLGDALDSDGGYDGLIYPSAQHAGGGCLVVFPDRLSSDSFVEFRSRTPGVPDARLRGQENRDPSSQ